jgi:mono/diheme cytochrome c family protein
VAADVTGSNLEFEDMQGVSCSACHRAVDPVYREGVSPARDQQILANLTTPVPTQVVHGRTVALSHNGTFVWDPEDYRRGPYEIEANPHRWVKSEFHRDSQMCATCHDVSNPVYTKQTDGTYRLNAIGTPHETSNKYDMFPVERTYSEWLHSSFATQAIYLPKNPNATPDDPDWGYNRFGGNNENVQTCQDCHMPRTEGYGASRAAGALLRTDLARHHFNGANTWVLRSVAVLYADFETDLTEESVNDSVQRAHDQLAAASDMELSFDGYSTLTTRVINMTGHKLPTGYPEGRRMWLNVKYFSASGAQVGEFGAYDTETAELSTSDTKVYEAKMGLDAHAAAASGKPVGESFHFVLNNQWLKDNRIPPMGFTNAAYASIGAAPVDATYADGQYWDDTQFFAPAAAVRAEVRMYFQTTTKEYIEFLRDMNTTNTAGQVAYDQWVLHGKSAPALMDEQVIEFSTCSVDVNGNGVFPEDADLDDLIAFFLSSDARADIDHDGEVTPDDFLLFMRRLAGEPCEGNTQPPR